MPELLTMWRSIITPNPLKQGLKLEGKSKTEIVPTKLLPQIH